MPKFYNDFSDYRLKQWCFHCGNWLAHNDINREHIPTRNLLLKPYPSNLPVAQVCKKCNESYSKDEEYFGAFISAVLSGNTEPEQQKIDIGRRVFSRNPNLRKRIDRSRRTFKTISGETKTIWKPEELRIQNVIVKNAKGHVFYECGEPIFSFPFQISVFPLESGSIEQVAEFYSYKNTVGVWPEVGSRWMQRVLMDPDFDDDGFFVVQPSSYKFRLDLDDGVKVRSIIHGYLATTVWWI